MTELLNTHTAIVGASGAGKTVTAKGHAEALLNARRHVCIIDPTSAWWGLRSNVAGDGPGFDIPVFGGPHGDVAITADQGEAIGAIIAGGVSAIVDMSSLRTGSEQRRFARDLCRRLRAKPDGNFHLIVDEADEFASQKPRDDYGFQVGEELIWMAKRGRLAGFVLTLITQRPASIDKEVLTQAQTLIIHQLVAPVDQKPIVDYIRDSADKVIVAAIRGSLASLDRGERWVYSPRLNVLERGVSPAIATFDSSRTPGPGEQAVEPRMLASIDLAEIRKALAPPVEEVADAEAKLGHSETAELQALRARVEELEAERAELVRTRQLWHDLAQSRGLIILRARGALQAKGDEHLEIPAQGGGGPEVDDGQTEDRIAIAQAAPRAKPQRQRQEPPEVTAGETAPALNAAARKMLDMLERIAPARVTWTSLAAMIGNKARGGNFNAARKGMRESGLVVEDGDTIRSAKPASDPMSRAEARMLWKSVLTNPAPRMIDALSDVGLTRIELGEALGIAPRGGNFNNGVAQLVRNGVAVDRGGVLHLTEPLPGESA